VQQASKTGWQGYYLIKYEVPGAMRGEALLPFDFIDWTLLRNLFSMSTTEMLTLFGSRERRSNQTCADKNKALTGLFPTF
jgi:hypothetical protein